MNSEMKILWVFAAGIAGLMFLNNVVFPAFVRWLRGEKKSSWFKIRFTNSEVMVRGEVKIFPLMP